MARTPEPAAIPDVIEPSVDKPPSTMKSIRFIRTHRNYHRDDCVGFPVAFADQLISRGVAVAWPVSAAVDAMIRK